jgi:transcriptional regulator with XRE-family HTH domain
MKPMVVGYSVVRCLGMAIKARREELGISQRGLALENKVSQNRILDIEGSGCSLPLLVEMAPSLQTTASALLASAEAIYARRSNSVVVSITEFDAPPAYFCRSARGMVVRQRAKADIFSVEDAAVIVTHGKGLNASAVWGTEPL